LRAPSSQNSFTGPGGSNISVTGFFARLLRKNAYLFAQKPLFFAHFFAPNSFFCAFLRTDLLLFARFSYARILTIFAVSLCAFLADFEAVSF
jgi:hypothetical protein